MVTQATSPPPLGHPVFHGIEDEIDHVIGHAEIEFLVAHHVAVSVGARSPVDNLLRYAEVPAELKDLVLVKGRQGLDVDAAVPVLHVVSLQGFGEVRRPADDVVPLLRGVIELNHPGPLFDVVCGDNPR